MRGQLHKVAAAMAILGVLETLFLAVLAGCNNPDNTDAARHPSGPEVSLAGTNSEELPTNTGESRPLVLDGPINLIVLLERGDVRIGMSKADLIDVLLKRPEADLLEFTLHSEDFTCMVAPPSVAPYRTDSPHPGPANAELYFLLSADRLVLALEMLHDTPDALQRIETAAEGMFGQRSSFPPRELRQWAADNNYLDDDGIAMYLNVEDAVARNVWHESSAFASFRPTGASETSYWFMLSPRELQGREETLFAAYGLVDPSGLPQDLHRFAANVRKKTTPLRAFAFGYIFSGD